MSHKVSAMKVGVDAVVLGSFVRAENVKSILDAGCGCGIIALMCAQRFPWANIVGIDNHLPSASEAHANVCGSVWKERLEIHLADFSDFSPGKRFDLIISNPPFFESGVKKPDSPRERARHACSFSPSLLLRRASGLLTERGEVAMIYPYSFHKRLEEEASAEGLFVRRELYYAGVDGKPPVRAAVQFGFSPPDERETLDIRIKDRDGNFTQEYINLTKDFYMNF